jgi:transposase-like protein
MPRGNSTQKRYSEEVKRDAVNLVVVEGYSRSAAAIRSVSRSRAS